MVAWVLVAGLVGLEVALPVTVVLWAAAALVRLRCGVVMVALAVAAALLVEVALLVVVALVEAVVVVATSLALAALAQPFFITPKDTNHEIRMD
jgi:hypothetical protein